MSGTRRVRFATAEGTEELWLHFEATPKNIAPARHAIAARARSAGLPEALIDNIALAASEALTNAVVHGFKEDQAGHVEVTAGLQAAGFVITVRDDGGGMVPRPDSPGLGLGLPIIAQLAATLDVRSDPAGGGTTVCMTFTY